MPKVICKLENAADEINGVKFSPLEDGGMLSEEVSDEAAELFASIPGYEIASGAPKTPAASASKAGKAKKAAAADSAAASDVAETDGSDAAISDTDESGVF